MPSLGVLVLLALPLSTLCTTPGLHYGRYPEGCSEVDNHLDGVYLIRPYGGGSRPFPVFCQYDEEGYGWAYIQRNLPHDPLAWDTFNYEQYEAGFGQVTTNSSFWIGLYNMYLMTRNEDIPMRMRIELEDLDAEIGGVFSIIYDDVSISPASLGYYLSYGAIDEESVNTTDGLAGFHQNARFSTKDVDQDASLDKNCGDKHRSGWWFRSDTCLSSNLNGDTITWNGQEYDVSGIAFLEWWSDK